MIHPPKISYLVGDNNLQIVTKFSSVLFNSQVKALRHDDHIFTFRKFILASLLYHKKYLKDVIVDTKKITVALLQSADVFFVLSQIL